MKLGLGLRGIGPCMAVALVACGGSSSPELETFEGDSSVEASVGAEGGRLTLQDGTALVVQRGVIGEEALDLSIEELSPGAVASVDRGEPISPRVAVRPHGTVLSEAVDIILPITLPQDAATGDIHVLRLEDEDDPSWSEVRNGLSYLLSDPEAASVRIRTTRFSVYVAVLGRTRVEVDAGPPDSRDCASVACGLHEHCETSSGDLPVCVCDEGWTGNPCARCARGFYGSDCSQRCDCERGTCNDGRFGDGSCVLSCADTSCGDNSTCAETVEGPTCLCDSGYQDNDDNGSCTPNCFMAQLNCDLGSCDDSEGTAICSCNTGADGDTCALCAEGFYGSFCSACACDAAQCDDGRTGTGACCGDGVVQAPEECDDRNTLACGQCSADCTAETTAAAATGSITAGANTDLPVEGETFTVGDGTTNVVFEFDNGDGVTDGNATVLITEATTPELVAAAIAAAINASALDITATPSGAVVSLEHDTAGSPGNVAITEMVSVAAFTVSGMSGGAAGDCSADTGCTAAGDCASGGCSGTVCL